MNKVRVLYICALVAVLIVCGALAYSQEKPGEAAPHMIVRSGDLKWSPIIKGCDLAPVSGDPGADGTPFVLRLRCVDGAKIPAHWHPTDENVTVLKGTFLAGMGEKFDESKLLTMNAQQKLLVVGHTDNVGTIDPKKDESTWYGSVNPICSYHKLWGLPCT